MKKSIFYAGILCLVVTLLHNTLQAQKKNPSTKTNPTSHEYYIDTKDDVSTGEQIINYKDGQHVYKFKINGEKITDLYVDDKKIPANEYSKYDDIINSIMLQIKKDKEQARLDMMQATSNQKQAKMDMERAQLDKMKAEEDMRQATKDKQMAELDRLQATKDKQRAEEDRTILNNLLSDIVSEKIAPDENSILSLVLNNNELIVNGKKQSSTLLQKFKTKYLKVAGTEINFQRDGSKRQFNIDKKED